MHAHLVWKGKAVTVSVPPRPVHNSTRYAPTGSLAVTGLLRSDASMHISLTAHVRLPFPLKKCSAAWAETVEMRAALRSKNGCLHALRSKNRGHTHGGPAHSAALDRPGRFHKQIH